MVYLRITLAVVGGGMVGGDGLRWLALWMASSKGSQAGPGEVATNDGLAPPPRDGCPKIVVEWQVLNRIG